MAEYWDLYDCERKPLGKLHRRGDEIPAGEYHLVAEVWTRDNAGNFLVSRRHPDKPFGLYWECTGGSVVAGEDSLTGAQRELEEELGIRTHESCLAPATFASAPLENSTWLVFLPSLPARTIFLRRG